MNGRDGRDLRAAARFLAELLAAPVDEPEQLARRARRVGIILEQLANGSQYDVDRWLDSTARRSSVAELAAIDRDTIPAPPPSSDHPNGGAA